MGLTAEFAEFAAGLTLPVLPPEIAVRTRLLILDLFGSIIRARHDAASTAALLRAVRALGLASGGNIVLGDRDCYAPSGAALLNGALAHSLDFDDTHAAGSLHPGAPVIAAALAAAEMSGADGAVLLAAIVAGYEVTCRLALALPAAAHYQRGFHPTATCGAFGAAAAAARALGLDAAGIASALGIALSQSAGSLQFLANGAWTKPFQVGWAAHCGLAAATLAREGFKGAAAPLEGQHGFLRAYAPAPEPARALQGLGEDYELMRTAVKPYPSCRYGHAGIDAALALREEYGWRAGEIDAVTLGLPRSGMLLIGAPAERKADPRNVVDAQFSGPFVIATALATGDMDWDSYRLLDDPAIRRLLPRIRCEHDAEIEAEFPANMSAKVTVRARGASVSRKVVVPRGEPANFPSESELLRKFASLADGVLGEASAARVAAGVLAIDQVSDVSAVLRLAIPAPIRLAGE